MWKPKRLIVGYDINPQQHGLYKIREYSKMTNEESYKKRTLHKNLDLSTAEAKLYQLESKLKAE